MKQIETTEYWKGILEKFSRHEGTIISFCKEHDVNVHRLYNQRMKLKNKNETKFHCRLQKLHRVLILYYFG